MDKMNIFQQAIKDKRDKSERLRSAHISVSDEITKLIDVNPSCGEPHTFDQVDGYSFNNRNQLRKWNVYKVVKLPSGSSKADETLLAELNYLDKNEVNEFFRDLNYVLKNYTV